MLEISSLTLHNLESFTEYMFGLDTDCLEDTIGEEINDNNFGTRFF